MPDDTVAASQAASSGLARLGSFLQAHQQLRLQQAENTRQQEMHDLNKQLVQQQIQQAAQQNAYTKSLNDFRLQNMRDAEAKQIGANSNGTSSWNTGTPARTGPGSGSAAHGAMDSGGNLTLNPQGDDASTSQTDPGTFDNQRSTALPPVGLTGAGAFAPTMPVPPPSSGPDLDNSGNSIPQDAQSRSRQAAAGFAQPATDTPSTGSDGVFSDTGNSVPPPASPSLAPGNFQLPSTGYNVVTGPDFSPQAAPAAPGSSLLTAATQNPSAVFGNADADTRASLNAGIAGATGAVGLNDAVTKARIAAATMQPNISKAQSEATSAAATAQSAPSEAAAKTAEANMLALYGTPDERKEHRDFAMNVAELSHRIAEYEDLVKNYGNKASSFLNGWHPRATALQRTLPLAIAENWTKVSNPGMGLRAQGVALNKEDLIPTGWLTPAEGTLGGVSQAKEVLSDYIRQYENLGTTHAPIGGLTPEMRAMVDQYGPTLAHQKFIQQNGFPVRTEEATGGMFPYKTKPTLPNVAPRPIVANPKQGNAQNQAQPAQNAGSETPGSTGPKSPDLAVSLDTETDPGKAYANLAPHTQYQYQGKVYWKGGPPPGGSTNLPPVTPTMRRMPPKRASTNVGNNPTAQGLGANSVDLLGSAG